MIGSANVNYGYILVDNPDYPAIAQDYEKTFVVLRSLPADVFLGAHGFQRLGRPGRARFASDRVTRRWPSRPTWASS